MFGIGLPELIVILGVALIVVGPEKLPELAKSLAKGLHELKKTASALKESFEEEVKETKPKDLPLPLPGSAAPDNGNIDAALGYADFDDAVLEGAESGGKPPADDGEPESVPEEETAGK